MHIRRQRELHLEHAPDDGPARTGLRPADALRLFHPPFDLLRRENELAMRRQMQVDAAEMLDAAGITNITTFDYIGGMGKGVHEMGTARMGRDPKTSVLNAHNQLWDAKNVFVTDGSCMTSSACVNPSLTYMALTARAVDFAVAELKRRNL